jgi:hypothetical protein
MSHVGVILGVESIFPAILVIYIRHYLVQEDKRRDALVASGKEIREVGLWRCPIVRGISLKSFGG